MKNPWTGQPYRGWRSTKLQLSLIAMAVVTGAYAMTGFNEHAFDGFVVGILGAAAIYTGGNVAEKRRTPELGADALPPTPTKENTL